MESYSPHIGKNVIETLTSGMYENAFYIYREYVQNAADQIDVAVEERILDGKSSGRIDITVLKGDRQIIIEDNATGIKSAEVLQFLGDVANSQKDRTQRKGFRGIGRLGGLGYCENLIFETTYQGEDSKSVISLDAKLLGEIIADPDVKMDAAKVISVITSIDREPTSSNDHYFKVKLIDVTRDELLETEKVEKYLSMVAPLPYNPNFSFSDQINSFFKSNGFKLDEYNVYLNSTNTRLFKAYKNSLTSKTGSKPVNIVDIDFFKIDSDDYGSVAIGWYCITDLLNLIISQEDFERGFRIRKENIQIGDEDTLNSYFKEDRFNHHFIGEIHVRGEFFIPNARRDFFNDNPTIEYFKSELRNFFENLHKLSHISSDFHNGIKKIQKFKTKFQVFENTDFKDSYTRNVVAQEVESLKEDAQKGEEKIKKAINKARKIESINHSAAAILQYKTKDKDLSIEGTISFDSDNLFEKPDLNNLNSQEKEIVYQILRLIEKNVKDSSVVINLKKKIVEHYNK